MKLRTDLNVDGSPQITLVRRRYYVCYTSAPPERYGPISANVIPLRFVISIPTIHGMVHFPGELMLGFCTEAEYNAADDQR